MSSKKNGPTSPGTNPQRLKLGSRVRCTDDGVAGRIIWANAVAVKIRWEDGEQVTWRRDALADRPIEILAEGGDDDQAVAPSAEERSEPVGLPQTEPQAVSSAPGTDSTAMDPAPVEQSGEVPTPDPTEVQEAVAVEQIPAVYTHAEGSPQLEVTTDTSLSSEPAAGKSEDLSAAKQPQMRELKTGDNGKEMRLSAPDAAAKVLAEAGQAMKCQELIAAMAAKGYWTSPGGKTPAATLYSAMLREITAKGAASRFVKTERGKFARTGVA
jgi:hypothetical protein